MISGILAVITLSFYVCNMLIPYLKQKDGNLREN